MTLKTLRLKKYTKHFKGNDHKWRCISNPGQATVEFVLLLPVIVIIMLGVSQLGYYAYLKNVLEHAASEAARVVATTNSENLASAQVYGICSSLNTENLDIRISPSSGAERITAEFFIIRLRYKNAGIFNFINEALKKDLLIESVCIMRMECKS